MMCDTQKSIKNYSQKLIFWEVLVSLKWVKQNRENNKLGVSYLELLGYFLESTAQIPAAAHQMLDVVDAGKVEWEEVKELVVARR